LYTDSDEVPFMVDDKSVMKWYEYSGYLWRDHIFWSIRWRQELSLTTLLQIM